MLREDIELIERQLAVRLPAFYVGFVTEYPLLPPEQADIAELALFNNPRRVITANQQIRIEGLPEARWPENLLVVGESGCGDYYAIHLDGESEFILCWDHELSDFEITSHSIGAFLGQLISES